MLEHVGPELLASFLVWAFAELVGLQRRWFILILSPVIEASWLRPGSGPEHWAFGGASLEGDDGLKDVSESVNPGCLGKEPSDGGSVRAEALGRSCLLCFQKREGIEEGRGRRGHQHSAPETRNLVSKS